MIEALVVFAAAFVAGMVNSVAGGGTLVSFPTLVWIGRDPIAANVTSTVGLWPGSFGAVIGYRRELAGAGRWMKLLIGPSIAGGALGARLLLRTPPGSFAAIVPYLILFATLLFAAAEPLQRRLGAGAARRSEPSPAWWIAAAVFQLAVAVYGGYFGAGIGILMLATLALLGLGDIHRMNGLKNFLAAAINGVAAVYFIFHGGVRWSDAIVMAAGAIAGGYGGAGIARRLGQRLVRRAVVGIGVAMALSLSLRR